MSNKSFADIEYDYQLAEYSERVLSRTTKNRCLYHYTKFTTFQNIVSSNELRLFKPMDMNDKAEQESIKGLSGIIFYSCFSLVPESAEMWKMYSENDNGCILEINFESAKKMRNFPVLKASSEEPLDKSLYDLEFNSVAYWSRSNITGTRYLKCMKGVNTKYKGSYESPVVAGMIKSEFWRFENEARLILRTKQEYKDDYFRLKLEHDFLNNCRIIISPFSSKATEEKIKDYCSDKHIPCRESDYSGTINY